ncbi:MAG: hypothetical protein AB2A00_08235 [Myxococcota bacterium]
MGPRVVVARSCWNAITTELDRVAPLEGVLLPLVALDLRDSHANPCSPVGLLDVATVVLAEARCLPPRLQHNSAARVLALPQADAWADGVVVPLVRRHPRLRAAAYLHSHPFATEQTWPSGGDVHGHMVPLLRRNVDAGLQVSFSFIACRSRDQRGWLLPCFAMDARERVVELGNAEVVADNDDAVVRARHLSLQRTPARFLLRRWRQQLRRHGLTPRVDELFDGWVRAKIRVDGQRVLVVLFPMDFPSTAPRYHLVNSRTGQVQRLDVSFRCDATEVLSLPRGVVEAA